MIDQFEAEKCLYPASTDNVRLMTIDNRPDPRANQDGTNPGTRAESRCKTPGVAVGGMLALGLMHNI